MPNPMKNSLKSKIKSPPELQEWLKEKKCCVVLTNGCFDILHKGHVTYLEKAKQLGDILVVALNSDDSVRKLKGPLRPVNLLEDRMEVVAALASVDFVTWFEEDTPLQLIRFLRPQVLVKGGDWKLSQIVGAEDVLSWNGQVRTLDFVDGKSTSHIIAKARQVL